MNNSNKKKETIVYLPFASIFKIVRTVIAWTILNILWILFILSTGSTAHYRVVIPLAQCVWNRTIVQQSSFIQSVDQQNLTKNFYSANLLIKLENCANEASKLSRTCSHDVLKQFLWEWNDKGAEWSPISRSRYMWLRAIPVSSETNSFKRYNDYSIPSLINLIVKIRTTLSFTKKLKPKFVYKKRF